MKHRILVASGRQEEWIECEAESAAVALRMARAQGRDVIRVTAARDTAPRRVRVALPVFLQELTTLLKAGLTVVEGIETLLRKERDPGFRRVLERQSQGLREGLTFSQAMAREAGLFPDILIAGIAASETSGGLSATLDRYLAYEARIDQIRRKVIASSIYPTLLLVIGGGVILFLIAYVLPRFATILEGSGRETSATSVGLIRLGQAMHDHFALVALGLLALAAAIAWTVTTDAGRRQGYALLSRLPGVSDIVATLGLSRLYRTLALLLEGGIALPRVLEMIRSIVPATQARLLADGLVRIRSGESFTQAFDGTPVLPPIAESLIRVGERSGGLAAMADKLADFLDHDLDRKVDTFSRLFEPLLMTAIGVVIGAVVLTMYTPIFDLVGSVGR